MFRRERGWRKREDGRDVKEKEGVFNGRQVSAEQKMNQLISELFNNSVLLPYPLCRSSKGSTGDEEVLDSVRCSTLSPRANLVQ